MNMIDNAIFYSKERTTVKVSLCCNTQEVVFTVRVRGIGVPKAEQSGVFGKFFRASNARKRRPDGTGVGLFLARKVVLEHGGSMIFTSKKNKGSTFGFVCRLISRGQEKGDKPPRKVYRNKLVIPVIITMSMTTTTIPIPTPRSNFLRSYSH